MQHRRNPALARLDVLVGEWEVTAIIDGAEMTGGSTTFGWSDDGGFLVQHADAEIPANAPPEWIANSPFPVATVTGFDDSRGTFSMLYADGRGISRVYEMTVDDGVWRIWRDAPGFFQRFRGTLGADGSTIEAYWEKSTDGQAWDRDFDLAYRKVA